eukprot:Amastigsp_a843794_10.p2 type:complete len:224 gc:universal Amastigsp_a843794_10:704-1375(+)
MAMRNKVERDLRAALVLKRALKVVGRRAKAQSLDEVADHRQSPKTRRRSEWSSKPGRCVRANVHNLRKKTNDFQMAVLARDRERRRAVRQSALGVRAHRQKHSQCFRVARKSSDAQRRDLVSVDHIRLKMASSNEIFERGRRRTLPHAPVQKRVERSRGASRTQDAIRARLERDKGTTHSGTHSALKLSLINARAACSQAHDHGARKSSTGVSANGHRASRKQ